MVNQQVQSLLENHKMLYLNKFFSHRVVTVQNTDVMGTYDLFGSVQCSLVKQELLSPFQKSLFS